MADTKLKILYIAKYLFEQTDENHTASAVDIIDHLASVGITAERKSVYSDIETLRDFGMDIETSCGRMAGYRLVSRDFELPELKMLIDVVQSSPFISEKQSIALIEKLEHLTSAPQAKALRRQVCVIGRVKTPVKSLFYNIDSLSAAISAAKCITFKYFDLDETGSKVYRKDGALYSASPVALCVDKYYYLVCYSSKSGAYRHYRVDRMDKITISDERADTPPNGFNAAKYSREVFQMFNGELMRVVLRFDAELLNAVTDRFGYDSFIHKSDGDTYTISADVEISPTFLGWVLSFGGKMKIISPASAAAVLRQTALSALKVYEEE